MPIHFTAAREVPANAGALVVPTYSGGAGIPAGVGAEVDAAFLAQVGFEGAPGSTQVVLADDGSLVVVVGLGEWEKVDADAFRTAGAAAAKATGRVAEVATTVLTGLPGHLPPDVAARAFVEGFGLASYRFDRYKRDPKPPVTETVTLVGAARLQKVLDRGSALVAAASLARDLVNEPAGALTPQGLAEAAGAIATTSDRIEVEVWDEDRIEREGLGALRGVSLGSDVPARFILLTYTPARPTRRTVALVGKGITFDSGGLSLKTADGMTTMKTDMSGAAAVLGAFSAFAALPPSVKVLGFIAATENMPNGSAIKPGDVLKARNGTTIEVLNTDAEGRLVLADALAVAVEQGADFIVDVATLTGAQVVALGRKIAGLMGNDDGLCARVEAAAAAAGEPVWRLPLPAAYRPHIDSEIADLKNIGNPGQAGTLIGGLFLQEFVGMVPWAHLDIAGPARADSDDGWVRKGGTGFATRTLIELVTTW